MGAHGGSPIALLVAVAMLTVGCLGMGGEESTPDTNLTQQRAEVSSATGGLEGVVTDAAVQPVEGANVTLVEPNETVQTSSDGSYAFSKVDPGTYTVAVRHSGFLSSQKETQIRAGEVSALDFVLTHRRSQEAYTQTIELKGFIECGAEIGWNLTDQAPEPPGPYDARYFYLGYAACSAPNSALGLVGGGNATNDRFEHHFQLQPQLDTVVYEMKWEPQSQFSEWMTTRMEVEDMDNDGLGTIFRTQGPSPIHIRLDEPIWEGLKENFTQQCTEGNDTYCGYSFEADGWPLQTRVFAAWQCANEDGGGCVVTQQPYQHVISAFYNEPAPEGYAVFEP